jgi:hypothetical protein
MSATSQELEYGVGEDENPATVVFNQESDEGPVTAEVLNEAEVEAESHESELNQYSEKVKKRIDKLTARLRETERREAAAIDYAQKVQAHAQQLQQKYQQTGDKLIGEAQNRIGTQVVALKQIIKKAREEGDIDTETEAQERLTSILMDQQRISDAAAQRENMRLAQQAAQAQVYQQQVVQQKPAPVQRVDPRAEDWAEKNPWFGSDTVMTHAAWGIHKELIQKEGFDPQSEEYYDEIDRRMRGIFPQKFNGSTNSRGNRPVQTVAPANRSTGATNARRTVRLTPSQVAIAKKLGVPLEEYAKYVKE